MAGCYMPPVSPGNRKHSSLFVLDKSPYKVGLLKMLHLMDLTTVKIKNRYYTKHTSNDQTMRINYIQYNQ